MKSNLVFALIGGFLLFVWQFVSFAGANLHGSMQEYTEQDQAILRFLEEIDLEFGMYALGAPSPEERTDPALQQAYMDRTEGRPWAQLNYMDNWTNNMGMNLTRGFIMNLLTAFLLFWMLKGMSTPSLTRRVLLAMAVGWVGFLYFPYTNFIWYKQPDIWAHMLDATLPFALLGALAHRMAS